jgi:hypothetical protein
MALAHSAYPGKVKSPGGHCGPGGGDGGGHNAGVHPSVLPYLIASLCEVVQVLVVFRVD